MSFTYNNINCETLGLFVEHFPQRPFPSRKQNIYQIHGRSGDLIVDENAFSNVTQTYDVYIRGASTFQQKAAAIANWLLAPNGYAKLVDSYDPTVYRMARFIGGVNFTNALNRYGKATISFDCCPQRFPLTDEELTGNLGDTFTLPTHTDMMKGLPIITITGWVANDTEGTIVTDDLTITIPALAANTDITIDFESHSIYDSNGDFIQATVTGIWKPLGDGDTIVTTKTAGTATPTISVNTRRWYL